MIALTGRAHHANDGRRVTGRDPYPPFHDVMMALDGEAAKVLGAIARSRWFEATRHALSSVDVAEDPWPPELHPDLADIEVAIARTAPPAASRPPVREIEALYLDMIRAARRRIYIENQYFTTDKLGKALAARLAEPDGPEIVLVLRLLSHGWLEEHTMQILRTQLVHMLRAADHHDRFHVYYPHIEGLKEGTCIDVHSKLMIVDDEILRIGSANLCNRSMGLDTECDVALEARGRDSVRASIRSIRNRLLGEHLDVPPGQLQQQMEHTGRLHKAIAVLHGNARTLKALDEVPEWPKTS